MKFTLNRAPVSVSLQALVSTQNTGSLLDVPVPSSAEGLCGGEASGMRGPNVPEVARVVHQTSTRKAPLPQPLSPKRGEGSQTGKSKESTICVDTNAFRERRAVSSQSDLRAPSPGLSPDPPAGRAICVDPMKTNKSVGISRADVAHPLLQPVTTLVLLIATAWICPNLHAHEVRPAHLTVTETTVGHYLVQWKVPAATRTQRIAIDPEFATNVTSQKDRVDNFSGGASIRSWQIDVKVVWRGPTSVFETCRQR